MNGFKQVIVNEPVLIQALVQVAIGMGTSFGLGWTGVQVGSVMAFTGALLALLARALVTPTAQID